MRADDLLRIADDGVEAARGPADEAHAAARERRMHGGVLHPDRRAEPARLLRR